jgi:hypothetical protein
MAKAKQARTKLTTAEIVDAVRHYMIESKKQRISCEEHEMDALIPKILKDYPTSLWPKHPQTIIRRIELTPFIFISVGKPYWALTERVNPDYEPEFKTSEVLRGLETVVESYGDPVELAMLKHYKELRKQQPTLKSYRDAVDALQKLDDAVAGMSTRLHYGAGYELQLCHINGAPVVNEENRKSHYKDLRHGDVLLGGADLNYAMADFNSERFGVTSLFVSPEGLRVKTNESMSGSFGGKYNNAVIASANYGVLVPTRKSLKGKGKPFPLYELMRSACKVQELLIKYRPEIKKMLRAEYREKYGR